MNESSSIRFLPRSQNGGLSSCALANLAYRPTMEVGCLGPGSGCRIHISETPNPEPLIVSVLARSSSKVLRASSPDNISREVSLNQRCPDLDRASVYLLTVTISYVFREKTGVRMRSQSSLFRLRAIWTDLAQITWRLWWSPWKWSVAGCDSTSPSRPNYPCCSIETKKLRKNVPDMFRVPTISRGLPF